MNSRFFYSWAAIVLFAALVHSASAQGTDLTPPGNEETAYRGGLVSPPQPKPKFALSDASGTSFDFWSKTQGSVTLLFFGYTHCDDICPLQMHTVAQALKKIPPDLRNQVKVVFVTTDPERDSPEILRSWLDRYDKGFVGLTGNEEAVKAAQIAANIPPARKSAVLPNGNYELGHAAFVLAYTKDNLAHVIYPAGVKQEDWVHDLPQLVKETWGKR